MKHNDTRCKIIEPGTQICLIQHYSRVHTWWRSVEVTANCPSVWYLYWKIVDWLVCCQIVVIGWEIGPARIPKCPLMLITLHYAVQHCQISKNSHLQKREEKKSISVHFCESVWSCNELTTLIKPTQACIFYFNSIFWNNTFSPLWSHLTHF